MIAIVSALLLTCVYFGTLLVKLHADLHDILTTFIGARLTAEDVRSTVVSTLNFNSSDTILTVMVIFTLLVVAIVILALGQRVVADSRVQSFRLKAGTIPELTLRKGHFWHLFLSHSAPCPLGLDVANVHRHPTCDAHTPDLRCTLQSRPATHSVEQRPGSDVGR